MDIARKIMLIMALFPNTTKGQRKALRLLADHKGTDWMADDISLHLHRLLASIIRHRATSYDSTVSVVGKPRARFYIQGEVSNFMRYLKGQLTHCSSTR